MTEKIQQKDVDESLIKLGRLVNRKLVLKRGWEDNKKAWINQIHTAENGETNEWHFCGFYDRDMTTKEVFKCLEFAQSMVETVLQDTAKLLTNVESRWDDGWTELDNYFRYWMRK